MYFILLPCNTYVQSIEYLYTAKKIIVITVLLLNLLFFISVFKPQLSIIDAQLLPCSYFSQRFIHNTLTRHIPTPAYILVE